MIRKIATIIIVLLPLLAKSQADVQLSQQLFSRVYYNPAAAGASQFINGSLIGRQQWVGFSNAPQTLLISADGYLEKINSGLGLSAVVDKLGHQNSINAVASYSYFVKLGGNTFLSFGLGVGILYKNVDVSEVKFPDLSDPNATNFLAKKSKLNPDFNFGFELNMEKLTVGAAVTHLDKAPSTVDDFSSGRHFYAYGRYKFELTPEWDFVPTISMQNVQSNTQFELNLMAFYNKRYWVGTSYRVNEGFAGESFVLMAGLYIVPDLLRLGYAYDLNVGNLSSYSSGSHEVMLGLKFKRKEAYSRKTPRLFLEY